MRTWSKDEILRSSNSNSTVMDLLLVGNTYACDGDVAAKKGSNRRCSQIILNQKQYSSRLEQSYQNYPTHNNNDTMSAAAAEIAAHFAPTHPVYEVSEI